MLGLDQALRNSPVVRGDYMLPPLAARAWIVCQVLDLEPVADDGGMTDDMTAMRERARQRMREGSSEVVDAEPFIITEKTSFVMAKDSSTFITMNSSHSRFGRPRHKTENSGRRSYPLFWINVHETVRKVDDDNVFLVLDFRSMHFDGEMSGEFQKKLSKGDNIQEIISRYREAANQTMEKINEESGTRKLDAAEVKNRLLQNWAEI